MLLSPITCLKALSQQVINIKDFYGKNLKEFFILLEAVSVFVLNRFEPFSCQSWFDFDWCTGTKSTYRQATPMSFLLCHICNLDHCQKRNKTTKIVIAQ